jgi:hypothetical protein
MARTASCFLVVVSVVLFAGQSFGQQSNITVSDGKAIPTLTSRGYGVISARSDGATVRP